MHFFFFKSIYEVTFFPNIKVNRHDSSFVTRTMTVFEEHSKSKWRYSWEQPTMGNVSLTKSRIITDMYIYSVMTYIYDSWIPLGQIK